MTTDNENNIINCFLLGPNHNVDMKVSAEITLHLQRDFKDVFTGSRHFDGTFSLQIIPDSKPYQVPLRHMVYALQTDIS